MAHLFRTRGFGDLENAQPFVLVVSVDPVINALTEMVVELKLGEMDNVAVWGCFRNMSPTGTTIAMQYLVDGYMVTYNLRHCLTTIPAIPD